MYADHIARDPAWRFLAREALADARYWRAQLERVSRA